MTPELEQEIECNHKFVYKGVEYEDGTECLPGTGACERFYWDVYFCEKCLKKEYQDIPNHDNTTYSKVLYDATYRT